MAPFPLSEARLVALFVEAVLLGVYLVTAGLCARTLLWRDGARRRAGLGAVAGALFVGTTVGTGLSLVYVLRVFVGHGGAEAELEAISAWVNVAKTVCMQAMTLVGDGMLVYRCFVVFFYDWRVAVLPALLWMANAAVSGVIVWLTATLRMNTLVDSPALERCVTAFLAITLVTNLLTTGMIVWRLRRLEYVPGYATAASHAEEPRTSLSAAITRIIVESGMLYTIFVVMSFCVELAKSNAIYPVSDMMFVVIGISFNLIIVRIGQGVAVGEEVTAAHTTIAFVHPAPTLGSTPDGEESDMEQLSDRRLTCVYAEDNLDKDAWNCEKSIVNVS